MQIKKFEALKMADALRAIKEEMGPDAVILSTREIRKKEGSFGVLDTPLIEVTAAIDSSPAPQQKPPSSAKVFHDLLKEMTLTGKFSSELAPLTEELKGIRETLGAIQAISAENERQFVQLQKSHEEMRSMLRKGMAPYYRGELAITDPQLVPFFDALIVSGIDPQMAEEVIEALRRETRPRGHNGHNNAPEGRIRPRLQEILEGYVLVSGPMAGPVDRYTDGPHVVVLVGPPGTGKTTTLAKLAADAVQQKRKVTLTAFDDIHGDVMDKLTGYGKKIGIEVVPLFNGGLREMIHSKHAGDIILVDTRGRTSDVQISELLPLFSMGGMGISIETHLVLSANTGEAKLNESVDRFSILPINRLLFTQMDETHRYGPLFMVMRKKEKPISYLATGPQFPGNLEIATPSLLAGLLMPADLPKPVPPQDVVPAILAPTVKARRPMAPVSIALPQTPSGRFPKVISVTSGKGGVGKTNVVANLAVALSNMGQRVVILDADLALGNLDVLFGVVPKYTLDDVVSGEKTPAEIMVQGPCGIQILPTGSGTADLAHLTSEQQLGLLSAFDQLEQDVDVFLIDTGAGISSNVLFFSTAAQEIVLVAVPEPTSLTDAYAVMKVLSKQYGEKRFKLLVNMVKNELEGKEVYRKLCLVSERFLDIAIEYIGSIPSDDYVKMAVCQQRAVVDIYPKAKASTEFARLAKEVIRWPVNPIPKGNIQFFWRRLFNTEMAALRSTDERVES